MRKITRGNETNDTTMTKQYTGKYTKEIKQEEKQTWNITRGKYNDDTTL